MTVENGCVIQMKMTRILLEKNGGRKEKLNKKQIIEVRDDLF